MTRDTFITAVADRSGLSRRDAERAVQAFLDAVKDALSEGDEITFTGFGKFANSRLDTSDKDVDFRVGNTIYEVKNSRNALALKAQRLRLAAQDLDTTQKVFEGRIDKTRQSLREIPEARLDH